MGSCCTAPVDATIAPDVEVGSKYSTKSTTGITADYTKYKLINKTQYNHDCIIFKFELKSKTEILGLPIGNHIMLKYENDKLDYPIVRAYTPITNDSNLGYFELLIKIYSDGEMTSQLQKLNVNDYLLCKGPMGSINYIKPNTLQIKEGVNTYRNLNNVKKIGMLAGGSGITPMYQILNYIHQNRDIDNTQVSLIFANKSEKDILLKSELEKIKESNSNITIYYTISKSDNDQWTQGIGRIDDNMITNNLFPPANDVVVMYCGPAGFNRAMRKLCEQIGHESTSMFRF